METPVPEIDRMVRAGLLKSDDLVAKAFSTNPKAASAAALPGATIFGGGATSSNAFAGDSAFAASGAPAATDALLLEAGLSFDLASAVDLSFAYNEEIATSGQTHAFKAGVGGAF